MSNVRKHSEQINVLFVSSFIIVLRGFRTEAGLESVLFLMQ